VTAATVATAPRVPARAMTVPAVGVPGALVFPVPRGLVATAVRVLAARVPAARGRAR
jgi:hypothetical protein